MLIKMRREAPLPPAAAASCHIQRAIILDREVDVVTPMVTQITFEGLIDEVTGIKHGSVTYTPSKREPGGGGGAAGGSSAAAAAPGGGSARGGAAGVTLLNSTDPFYKEFRDLPYYITSSRCVRVCRQLWVRVLAASVAWPPCIARCAWLLTPDLHTTPPPSPHRHTATHTHTHTHTAAAAPSTGCSSMRATHAASTRSWAARTSASSRAL
jgi:hypothetical protein